MLLALLRYKVNRLKTLTVCLYSMYVQVDKLSWTYGVVEWALLVPFDRVVTPEGANCGPQL